MSVCVGAIRVCDCCLLPAVSLCSSPCVRVRVRVCVYACMRVCVRMHACTHARTHARKHARTHARQVPRFGQGACGRMHSRLLLLFLGAPLRGLALHSCRIHQQGSLRLSLCSPRRTRAMPHVSARGLRRAGAQDAAAECTKLSSSMIDLRGAAADHVGKTANIPPQPSAPAVTRDWGGCCCGWLLEIARCQEAKGTLRSSAPKHLTVRALVLPVLVSILLTLERGFCLDWPFPCAPLPIVGLVSG